MRKTYTGESVEVAEPLRVQFGQTAVDDPSRRGYLDAGSAEDLGKAAAEVGHGPELSLVFSNRCFENLKPFPSGHVTANTLDPQHLHVAGVLPLLDTILHVGFLGRNVGRGRAMNNDTG